MLAIVQAPIKALFLVVFCARTYSSSSPERSGLASLVPAKWLTELGSLAVRRVPGHAPPGQAALASN
jgi:hypothetical protein